MKTKTVFNLIFFAVIVSFFVSPLSYESKILLQRLFAGSIDILPYNERFKIDEDWILKDKDSKQFNFNGSKGRVRVVYFWRSWQGISLADLPSIEKLYNTYKDKVDFYIITDEDPKAKTVEKVLKDRKLNFVVTYQIIEQKCPLDCSKIPSGYIINKQGIVIAKTQQNINWNSEKVRGLLDEAIEQ